MPDGVVSANKSALLITLLPISKKERDVKFGDIDKLVGELCGLYCPKCGHELYENYRMYWCSNNDESDTGCHYKIKK